MGLRADTLEEIRKELTNKIHGQPTDQDLTLLEKELISIAANVPTALGGGNHGYAGIIVEPTKYLIIRNDGESKTTVRLLCKPRRGNNHIQ
jgi:hypothetical protein